MVYRGVVIEKEKNHIVVVSKDYSYFKLKKKGHIDIGKEILFIEDDIIKERNVSHKSFIGVAAVIILFIMSVTFIAQFGFLDSFNTYAVVSLDINPSLEFEIDKQNVVRKVIPLNEEAKDLIEPELTGMKIEEAIEFAIYKAIEKQYLRDDNNTILISNVLVDDENNESSNLKQNIIGKLQESESLEDVNLVFIESNKEDLKEARKNNVSVGKYKVYEIIQKNKSKKASIEEIKNKTVSEITRENGELLKGNKMKLKKQKRNQEEKGKEKDEEKHKDNKGKIEREENKERHREQNKGDNENKERNRENNRENNGNKSKEKNTNINKAQEKGNGNMGNNSPKNNEEKKQGPKKEEKNIKENKEDNKKNENDNKDQKGEGNGDSKDNKQGNNNKSSANKGKRGN